MTKPNVTAADEVVFNHQYTDIEEYVKDIAREHTIANMGQELKDYVRPSDASQPQRAVGYAFNAMLNDVSEDDEGYNGIMEEYRSWLEDARRDALKVQKQGLPLTLANARDAFEKKGFFSPGAAYARKRPVTKKKV